MKHEKFEPGRWMRPNGHLSVNLGWRGGFQKVTVTGGPYDACDPSKYFGVCVRAERVPHNGYHLHLPIPDFGIPSSIHRVEMALVEAFSAALQGRQVYVGCAGGYGRTGLFLALMAKAAGVKDPVQYVRTHYHAKAVETKAQMDFVETFDVDYVRRRIRGQGWRARLQRILGAVA